jgi:hypothetical protein
MIERGLWTAEISSTHGFGQVYDDACDVGLTIISAKTGAERVFVASAPQYDAEGDILSWELLPADGIQNARILIFND